MPSASSACRRRRDVGIHRGRPRDSPSCSPRLAGLRPLHGRAGWPAGLAWSLPARGFTGLFVRDDLLGARDDPVVSDGTSGQDGLLGVPDGGSAGSAAARKGRGAARTRSASRAGPRAWPARFRPLSVHPPHPALRAWSARRRGARSPGASRWRHQGPRRGRRGRLQLLEVERALVDREAGRPGGGRGSAAGAELRVFGVTPIEIKEGQEPATAFAHRAAMRPERPDGLGQPRSARSVRPLPQQVQCVPEVRQLAVDALEPVTFGRGVGAVDGAQAKSRAQCSRRSWAARISPSERIARRRTLEAHRAA